MHKFLFGHYYYSKLEINFIGIINESFYLVAGKTADIKTISNEAISKYTVLLIWLFCFKKYISKPIFFLVSHIFLTLIFNKP